MIRKWLLPFTHAFHKHLLNTYDVSVTILDAGDTSAYRTESLLSAINESSIFREVRRASRAEWGEEFWLKLMLIL